MYDKLQNMQADNEWKQVTGRDKVDVGSDGGNKKGYIGITLPRKILWKRFT